ncbi:ABC transporter permease [Streptomyces sp. DT2A-34]|uniref:FtsX-like permease family protein n=1 Tax=Streptomyces sp. DT2A-34 TaxID=3051182 RepID=UPI00265C5B6B|nr:FtsX-like permease family protein [Streptomyces sp. DT2A-34]MDO0914900.1 ABC transporter permease [Streptomyces sp. DT2A-34]
MRADLRLAWQLIRGSDRREWWRVGLTALGAALATGFALAGVALASLDGYNSVPLAHGLLNTPGGRSGVIFSLALLLIPVLGFLGQSARIGAVHRDRRLAGLRLAGATPWQVRRIAALEAGLACLLGSALASAVAVPVLLSLWTSPAVLAWAGMALVVLAVPALGAAVSALALRRVVASPLGWVRRVRTARRPGRVFLVATGLLVVLAVLTLLAPVYDRPHRFSPVALVVLALALLVGAAAVWLTGWSSGLLGRTLAARAQRPALLIAAERLRDDPWAAARTHAAVLLVTVVSTGFVGVRQVFLADLHAMRRLGRLGMDMEFYTTGLDLTAAAILVALGIVLSALAVGTAESLATRRRGLAVQNAAGVPRGVLARALFLETALPLVPAVVVAGSGGMAIGAWYASIATEWTVPDVPYVSLLVPLAVYACCLLAAATSLPLLHRSLRPAELRYG